MNREEKIAQCRVNIPKAYRRIYDKAVSGKSLRASAKAFCLECVQWQREEVRLCTSLACPLYPHRPYRDKTAQDFTQSVKNRGFSGNKHTNGGKGNDYAG